MTVLVVLWVEVIGRREARELQTCGRPWPHEWEGPAPKAWEGRRGEAPEGLESRASRSTMTFLFVLVLF